MFWGNGGDAIQRSTEGAGRWAITSGDANPKMDVYKYLSRLAKSAHRHHITSFKIHQRTLTDFETFAAAYRFSSPDSIRITRTKLERITMESCPQSQVYIWKQACDRSLLRSLIACDCHMISSELGSRSRFNFRDPYFHGLRLDICRMM